MYHRTMLNDFFTSVLRGSRIRSVAEIPLDSYGMVGVGSLVFAQQKCQLTLISDNHRLLERGSALMKFNQLSDVSYLHSSVENIAVPDNSFDFSWSYERIQAIANPTGVLTELCRVSKAAMVVVPNRYNYGQYAHYLYHRFSGNHCDYVGPNPLMRRAPIRDALQKRGMAVIREGMIDIPWWPLFPELPNLVRSLIGGAPVAVDPEAKPERSPEVVPLADVPRIRHRVDSAAFIEHSSLVPKFIKMLFAHSVYVIGCKPEYREELGL